MLTVFDVDHSVGADQFDFKELCPAFIQQAKSGACKESGKTETEVDKDMGKSKFNRLVDAEMGEGPTKCRHTVFTLKFQNFYIRMKWKF